MNIGKIIPKVGMRVFAMFDKGIVTEVTHIPFFEKEETFIRIDWSLYSNKYLLSEIHPCFIYVRPKLIFLRKIVI